MNEFVDWLAETIKPIKRIARYDEWLTRFETALRALPEQELLAQRYRKFRAMGRFLEGAPATEPARAL